MFDRIMLRKFVKTFVDPLGLGKQVRQGVVELSLLPEKAYFGFKDRPSSRDAILIVGSGRSGTTWLHDVLSTASQTQPIFEPLSPTHHPTIRRITGWDHKNGRGTNYYLRKDANNLEWHHLLEEILTGRFRNYWTDYKRSSYFPRRYLIKFVRANLLLGYLYHNFQPKIIFMLRHPCAVIESRMRVGFPAEPSYLLKQKALVEDYLAECADDIASVQPDTLEAHAICWAVENSIAIKQLETIPHIFVYYEDLFMNPATELDRIMNWLGLVEPDLIHSIDFSQRSRMSDSNNSMVDIMQRRLGAWRSKLNGSDIATILKWTNRLEMVYYSQDL